MHVNEGQVARCQFTNDPEKIFYFRKKLIYDDAEGNLDSNGRHTCHTMKIIRL